MQARMPLVNADRVRTVSQVNAEARMLVEERFSAGLDRGRDLELPALSIRPLVLQSEG